MSDIDVVELRDRTLVLPDEYWAHEGDCGGSLCEGCGHCLHSLSPACDHKCGGGPGGCGDFVMTDEVRYRLDVLALLDRLAAAEAAVEEVRQAFDPGELDCGRIGMTCRDVHTPDRWCRACRITNALDPKEHS